jgi:hypothetical protein
MIKRFLESHELNRRADCKHPEKPISGCSLAHALHEHGFLIDHINDQMVNNGIDIPERGTIRTHDCK